MLCPPEILFGRIFKGDKNLQKCMERHYSKPKGFVGRHIIYSVYFGNILYGYTVGGSATLYLPGRYEALGLTSFNLNNIVNNTFFHIEKNNGKYPIRNFLPKIIKFWRERISIDWQLTYGDKVLGFETLVELPRTGECYLRDNWIEVGITKGYTCKRISGKSTDAWSGKRVWNIENLIPKRVLVYKVI